MNSKAALDSILPVCDDVHMQASFNEAPAKEGDKAAFTSPREEALRRLERELFDLAIVHFNTPGLDSREFLKLAKPLSPAMRSMAFRAYEAVESATAAAKKDAYEYLPKPVNNEGLKWRMEEPLDLHRPARKAEHLQGQAEMRSDFADIVGESLPMRNLFRMIKRVADSNSTVLIQGETGTGKELIARAIHHHSPRHDRAFVAIDCGALPDPLLESELFGHVRGAFTGAISNKRGLFQEAHEGTLLLDEIGNSTPAFQAKVLRVLQESEIRPVGSSRSVKVDVRVLASTNQDLKKAMEEQTFRQDLYYRLAVVLVVLPPLRQRREDIPLLVEHFLRKYCQATQLAPKHLSAKALKRLVNAPWPGNVRELEHVIERAVLLSSGPEIKLGDLLQPPADHKAPMTLKRATERATELVERKTIAEAIQQAGDNRSQAAKLLGITRATLYNKLKRYHLTY